MRKGLDAWRGTGSKLHVPYRLARTADALRLAGIPEHGLNVIAEAICATEQTGDRWYEPELHHLKGELLALAGRSQSETASYFRRAVEVAAASSARLIELRAATSLAQLWRDEGRCAEARALVAPIYSWFTEGFDTPDLKAAETLLNQIS
jgi:predicted ATPase